MIVVASETPVVTMDKSVVTMEISVVRMAICIATMKMCVITCSFQRKSSLAVDSTCCAWTKSAAVKRTRTRIVMVRNGRLVSVASTGLKQTFDVQKFQ